MHSCPVDIPMNDKAKKLKCGLVMPISAIDGCLEDHWVEVKEVIKEALLDTDFNVELVSDSNETGIIHKRIVQNIYDSDIIVCDVSAKNPNVMLELGMRLAFDKPVIIIRDDKTDYSFDTSPIEHLPYPRDLHYPTIQAFKSKLRDKVTATQAATSTADYTTFLKHFGQFVVAKIDEKKVGKDDFILAELSELRSEVSLLSKLVRSRDERPMGRLADLMRGHSIDTSNAYVPEAEFVQKYFKKHGAPFTAEEATTTKKLAFHELYDEYLKRHVPANTAIKDHQATVIRQRLLDAIQFYDLI